MTKSQQESSVLVSLRGLRQLERERLAREEEVTRERERQQAEARQQAEREQQRQHELLQRQQREAVERARQEELRSERAAQLRLLQAEQQAREAAMLTLERQRLELRRLQRGGSSARWVALGGIPALVLAGAAVIWALQASAQLQAMSAELEQFGQLTRSLREQLQVQERQHKVQLAKLAGQRQLPQQAAQGAPLDVTGAAPGKNQRPVNATPPKEVSKKAALIPTDLCGGSADPLCGILERPDQAGGAGQRRRTAEPTRLSSGASDRRHDDAKRRWR